MKLLLLALGLGSGGPNATQPVYFDYGLLRYGGAPAQASRAELAKCLGQPARITRPAYECGFLSASEQHQPFYSLHYGPALFTGNAKFGYVLDQVKLRPGARPLRYGSVVWGATTTRRQLARYFQVQLNLAEKPQPDGSTLLFVPTRGDDGAVFVFRKGRLVEFQYWSPC